MLKKTIFLFLFLILTSCKNEYSTKYTSKHKIKIENPEDIENIKTRLKYYSRYSGVNITTKVNSDSLNIQIDNLFDKALLKSLLENNGVGKFEGLNLVLHINDSTKFQILKNQNKKVKYLNNSSINIVFKDRKLLSKFSDENLKKKVKFMIGDSVFANPYVPYKIDNGILGMSFPVYSNFDGAIAASILSHKYPYLPNIDYLNNRLMFKNEIIREDILNKYYEIKSSYILLNHIANDIDYRLEKIRKKPLHQPVKELYPKSLKNAHTVLLKIDRNNACDFIMDSEFKDINEIENFIEKLHSIIIPYQQAIQNNLEISKSKILFEKSLAKLYPLTDSYSD